MTDRDRVNILLVDDQPAKLLSLETIVASLGENILKASSAEEALHVLLANDIAVVLVDVCMPGMDGFELAEMIRGHPRFGRTAIIFISAVHLTDADRLKGYDLGAVDYIPVPIIPEVLKAKVAVFADLHRKTGQLKRLNQELEARVAERTAERERLAAIVEGSGDAIVSADLNGIIQSWNPAAEQLFEYPAAEALGKPINIIIPQTRMEEEPTIIQRVARGERVVQFQTERRSRSGAVVHVSLSVSPVFDTSGAIIGVSKIMRDISAARTASRERDRLLAVLEATPDFVATADASGNIRYMNPAARRMIGLTGGESAVGLPFESLYPPDVARFVRETAMPAAARQLTWEGETVIRSRNGEETPVSQVLIAHKGPSGDGPVEVFSTVARDITERRRAEAVLTRDRETLERLVAERTAELEASNERLRITDRMATIGTLSAGLGHDMGNLLLPVRMRLEAIESCNLPPAVQEDVSAIRKASDYLQRLARSLRLLAIDPEADAKENSTDLTSWWEDTEGMLRNGVVRPTILSGDFTGGGRGPLPPVRIGKAALTQIAFNIVQNAGDILRGREDGRVHVSAHALPGGEAVRLCIGDNGPGMTDETRRRCMEPFFTTKTRGLSTGLGLSLVSGLVKSNGGSIHIDSAHGRGTVFNITLPAAQSRQPGAESDLSTRGLAVVALTDARLSAHVSSVLASLSYDVRHEPLPADVAPAAPASDADVWITQAADDEDLRMVDGFASAHPRQRVIVFCPSQLSGQSAGPAPCPLRLDLRTRPSELRDRLRRELADVVFPASRTALPVT
ncbi:MAG TPA: PAS domain S-box protein [Phycisphaerales bacterium]|nr:PAS domain S-box protein [Phycisphaerales bacterium]